MDAVRMGPYEHENTAQEMAAGLREQLDSTAHVEGTVIETGAFRPDLDHLEPRVPTTPYALAEAMDDDPGGDGTGRNFPHLYARLCAQELAEYARNLWGRAGSTYDYLHADPADEQPRRFTGALLAQPWDEQDRCPRTGTRMPQLSCPSTLV
ncbi:hypothetical protein [Streptomyces wedmorensis]